MSAYAQWNKCDGKNNAPAGYKAPAKIVLLKGVLSPAVLGENNSLQ